MYSWRKCVKGTVSRDGGGMLRYIFGKLLKNAIASDEKMDFVKGRVNHEHLKDSVPSSVFQIACYVLNCGVLT